MEDSITFLERRELGLEDEKKRLRLYVDECIEGTLKVMRSNYPNPLNIGSEESVSINDLVSIVSSVAGKNLQPYYVEGPQGVRGRNSDNNLIAETVGWRPSTSLRAGLEKTYPWIEKQLQLL